MICYLDMTFCVSSDCENKCNRKLTPEIKADAEEWWKNISGDMYEKGAPIAMSCFCGGNLTEVMEVMNKEEK